MAFVLENLVTMEHIKNVFLPSIRVGVQISILIFYFCRDVFSQLINMNKSLPTGLFDQVRFGKKFQNANFLVEELIAIINSAQFNNSITEKDCKTLKGRKTIH